MSLTIYDSSLGTISQDKSGQFFLVDSQYSPTVPSEDGLMIAEAGSIKGMYYAPANLFQRIQSDDVYPYQLLIQSAPGSTAIVVDRLNENFVVLSAVVNGVCQSSQAFEQRYDEGDFKLFCSRNNIPEDTPLVNLSAYARLRKKPAPFIETGERLQNLRTKQKEVLALLVVLLLSVVSLSLFGANFIERRQLTAERDEIAADIARITANVPQGNIQAIEKLQRDEEILSYMKELSMFGIVPVVTVTPDGVTFKSWKGLAELRRINKRVRPLQADTFFLPVAGGKLPCEGK